MSNINAHKEFLFDDGYLELYLEHEDGKYYLMLVNTTDRLDEDIEAEYRIDEETYKKLKKHV